MSDYVCDHSILVRHPDQPDETCIYCGKKFPVSAPPLRKVWIANGMTNERVFASKDAALRYTMDALESALEGESEADLKELAELSVREFEVFNDY